MPLAAPPDTMLYAKVPLKTYGEVIGHIPQVEQTYRYFHSAYSHMNEHQLAIAETTNNHEWL